MMTAEKKISAWLFATAFMVFAMAVIGAVTRLTESGLSMVEWRPLIGALPPLSAGEWERVFALYQDTPEFQKKNNWMSLKDFKTIFFWEWFHRLWGRLIGIVYALPLLLFWVRRMIPQGYKPKLLIALALGAGQGVMGWIMVKSGLVDHPSVSHIRLAAHLGLAFVIFSYLLWLGFSLIQKHKDTASFCLRRHGWTALGVLGLTIIWGAFTAGLDGGMIYNSWPLMGHQFIPAEIQAATAFLDSPAGVQFVHRWLAVLALVSILSFAWRIQNMSLALMVFVQVGLGLAALLSQVWLPLAAAHQAGAFILTGLMIYTLRTLHRV